MGVGLRRKMVPVNTFISPDSLPLVFLTYYTFPRVFSDYLGFESFCLEFQLSVQTLAFRSAPSANNPASAGEDQPGSPWVQVNDNLLLSLL